MTATNFQGPLLTFGPLDVPNPVANPGSALSGSHNSGASLFYQGVGFPDPRFVFPKDSVAGFKGCVRSNFQQGTFPSANLIPATHTATAIASAANTVSGTAMTLGGAANYVAASVQIPMAPAAGTAPVTAALTLDFGFALGTTVSGSAAVTVADGRLFPPGMPIVVAANGATPPWLTNVLSVSTNTVTMASVAPFSATAARIGTGNIWQPNEGLPVPPSAAFPYLASGPALLLDPRQALGRGIVITCNNALGAGGAITIAGWDVYGYPQTETITSVPGSALATYGKKAWKYIASVTPGFTDATYTYSVGTSDVFGFNFRSGLWEETVSYWAGLLQTATQGWLVADVATATATTGDPRGTLQTSAIGGGTGIGSTASNGTVSGLAMTGQRLVMNQNIAISQAALSNAVQTSLLYGVTPA